MDWLRKTGTLECFQRSPLLAARKDMEPVSEKDALAFAEKLKALAKVQREARRMQVPVEEIADKAPKDYNAMPEEDLRAKAKELKILIPDNAPVEEIRKKVKVTLVNDGVVPAKKAAVEAKMKIAKEAK